MNSNKQSPSKYGSEAQNPILLDGLFGEKYPQETPLTKMMDKKDLPETGPAKKTQKKKKKETRAPGQSTKNAASKKVSAPNSSVRQEPRLTGSVRTSG